jgi:DNA-binding beta-propeller fold protein YncE
VSDRFDFIPEETEMNKKLIALLTTLFLVGGVAADEPVAVKPNAAKRFATLPDDLRFPEGITSNPFNGDIYVGTFDGGVLNSIVRYSKSGHLVARNDFAGITPLLGLAFNPFDGQVYVASVDDFTTGGSRIVRIPGDFTSSTAAEEVAFIPSIGAPPNLTIHNPDGSDDIIEFGNNARVPNALAFDSAGDLFVSDSFQGAIFRIDNATACATPCPVTTVAHDGRLATAGFPPFGANGLALSADESVLFIANTGDDRILTLDLMSGMIDTFAESINGADGIAFDDAGNLWVAANQADQVVALNSDGRVIAELGEFLGVRIDGAARGLLFPASLTIVNKKIFVTNLAIPLTTTVFGDEPEEDVTTYTISRINIPNL